METNTVCSLTFTVCKHRMPCGWCELKNKECDSYYTYPRNYEEIPNIYPKTVQVYAAPSGAPTVTYENRSEE